MHLLEPRHPGLLLPVLPIAGLDRVDGTVELMLPAGGPGLTDLAQARPGDRARLSGPLGRGFEIDSRSRFLLVVTDAAGLARVRALASEAVEAGRQVTLLLEAPSVTTVPPSSLLPDETEYVVATADGSLGHRGRAADLVPDYEAWADQCFSAGTDELLVAMTTLAAGRDRRMGVARLGRRRGRRGAPAGSPSRRRAWLQVALAHEAGCELGICLGCVAAGSARPERICREGPVFAAAELRWRTGT